MKPLTIMNYASDATLAGGPQSGSATRLQPGAALLKQGFYQGRRVPARFLSWILGTLDDSVQIAAHSALRSWAAVTIPQVGTDLYADIIGQRLSRSYGVTSDLQRLVYLVGTDTSGSPANLMRIAKSTDGTQFDPATLRVTTLPTFTGPTQGHAGAANETIITNAGPQFAYSVNDAVTWTPLSTAYSGSPNILTAHYVPGAGSVAGYYALTSASTTHCAKSSTLSGLATAPTFSTIGVGGFSFSTTQSFADNGSVLLVSGVFSGGAALYRSTNGTSWSLILSYAGTNSAIAWSEFWNVFVAVDDSGQLRTSPDGATWTLVRSGLTAANGFSITARSLVACGAAIALPTQFGSNYGIAYSLDLGLTWNYHYIGTGSLVPTLFKSLNGRLYGLGSKTLWRSGYLGAPAGEF